MRRSQVSEVLGDFYYWKMGSLSECANPVFLEKAR